MLPALHHPTHASIDLGCYTHQVRLHLFLLYIPIWFINYGALSYNSWEPPAGLEIGRRGVIHGRAEEGGRRSTTSIAKTICSRNCLNIMHPWHLNILCKYDLAWHGGKKPFLALFLLHFFRYIVVEVKSLAWMTPNLSFLPPAAVHTHAHRGTCGGCWKMRRSTKLKILCLHFSRPHVESVWYSIYATMSRST